MISRLHIRLLAGFWTAVAAITVLGSWCVERQSLVRPLYSGRFRPIPLFWIWTRWDSGWYQQIVTDGYSYDPHRQSTIVFWPTYPLTVRPLYRLGFNPFIAGFTITVLATSVVIVSFIGWQRDYRYRVGVASPTLQAVVLGTLAWLAYPYAYYVYGSNYSDALFVAVTVTAFWMLERDKPLLAGIIGIAATAGRPFGWAVTVALLIRVMERRWREQHDEDLPLRTLVRSPLTALRALKPTDFSVGLSGLGVLGYLGFLWIRFGSPLVFATNEDQWGQGSGPAVVLKFTFWRAVFHQWTPSPLAVVTLIVQAIAGTLVLTLGTWTVYKRQGIAIAVYVVITILPPLLFTKDFQGIGRYCLSTFPVFAVLGYHLAGRIRVAAVGLAVSGLAMVFLSTLFARGFYLS